MCHHHELREWESLREELAELDEPTDEATRPDDEPEPGERAVTVPPADD